MALRAMNLRNYSSSNKAKEQKAKSNCKNVEISLLFTTYYFVLLAEKVRQLVTSGKAKRKPNTVNPE